MRLKIASTIVIVMTALVVGYFIFIQRDSTLGIKQVSKQNGMRPEAIETSKEAPVTTPSSLPKTLSQTERWESTFGFPYPVSWQENGIHFDLTKVTLGEEKIPPDPYVSSNPTNRFIFDQNGKEYFVGENIYALLLYLKIRSSDSYESVALNLRRELNEEGDFAPPNMRHFVFPESGGTGIRPNTTFLDQKVIFIVSKDERNFVITSGGSSNVFFEVEAVPGGKIAVKKLSP